jgi:type II secretory pathway component PulF
MPRFRFQATDATGGRVSGAIDAPDESQASERLRNQGFVSIEHLEFDLVPDDLVHAELVEAAHLTNQPVTVDPVQRDNGLDHGMRIGQLGARAAEEVLQHVAQASMAQAPLAEGLRAAAEETPSRRVSAALRFLAREVARGKPLPEALNDPAARLPPHVRGLVAASMRTGRLGPALEELLDHHRNLRAMFWSIWGSLAYPLIVLALAVTLLGFLMLWIVPQFEVMFTEFELRLPVLTSTLLFASQSTRSLVYGPAKWVLGVCGIAMLAAMYLYGTGRGGANVQRLLAMMPVFGPLWVWSGASSFSQLLATLLNHDIPLPDALRLAGDGMQNAELRRAGHWLSKQVQGGQQLSDLVEASGCLPASSVPILRWGEQAGVLGEAARSLSELFADRVWARTAWLRTAAPPVIYIFVILSVGFAITSLFMPLVSLIQGLS